MGNFDPGRQPNPPGMPWAAGPQPGQPSPARPIPLNGAAPQPIPLAAAGNAPVPLAPGMPPLKPMPVMPARPMPLTPGSPLAAPFGGLPDSSRPVLREQTPEESERPEIEKVVKGAPPYLVSGIVHMTILIVLGLWVLTEPKENNISLEVTYSEELGEQLDDEAFELASDEALADQEIITPNDLMPVEDPLQAPFEVNISPFANASSSDVVAPQIGMLLKGRTVGMRSSLLRKYGGSATTEGAVKNALDWLVRNQRKDGSWSLSGPYSDGFSGENQHAATAMALLAFLGNGHTHEKHTTTTYSKAVAKGIAWLMRNQDAEGCFYGNGNSHSKLYSHAQCTMAICELYAMTNDMKLQKPAQKAVDYCLEAQGANGGWRYNKGQNGDTSVTGWFMMALQSAKMAYLIVPDEALARVSGFLDGVQADGGRRYGYLGPSDVRPSMTAEGLLCRQYLGWEHDDDRLVDGAKFVEENLINWDERNAYYWYYATQVLHHMEGDGWTRWNDVMRELLPAKQVKKGAERGSWDPAGDQWGPQGGRLFVTCLHTYMLEVYYRHLPIYKYRLGE
jgi:hypothetical protein